MIKARVNTFADFSQVTAELEARTLRALNEAAAVGKAVAEERAGNVGHFEIVHAHPVPEGFASGLRASPLVRIFEKGSLGKRSEERVGGGLKR